jgi:hypothetical protein
MRRQARNKVSVYDIVYIVTKDNTILIDRIISIGNIGNCRTYLTEIYNFTFADSDIGDDVYLTIQEASKRILQEVCDDKR